MSDDEIERAIARAETAEAQLADLQRRVNAMVTEGLTIAIQCPPGTDTPHGAAG